MTHAPFVSVVMPVYNVGDRLLRSVASVLEQSYSDLELIIIDDGSTDDTLPILRCIENSEARIRVETQPNAGPAAARNHGIRIARGRVIAFLDADDVWHLDRLKLCLAHLSHRPQAGMLYSRVEFTGEKRRQRGTVTRHFKQLQAQDLIADNPICTTSNIIARASLLDRLNGFDEEMAYIEDQDIALRTVLQTPWTVEGVDAVLVQYACSDTSRSSALSQTEACWKKLVAHVRHLLPADLRNRLHRFEASFYRNLARRALRPGGSTEDALRALKHAFAADPLLFMHAPKRTGLTLAGLVLSLFPVRAIQELVR